MIGILQRLNYARRMGVAPIVLAAVIAQHRHWLQPARRAAFFEFLDALGAARTHRQARDMSQPPETPFQPHLHEDDPAWARWHAYHQTYVETCTAAIQLLDDFVTPGGERSMGWYGQAMREMRADPAKFWATRNSPDAFFRAQERNL
tara:strand:+ start:8068 stop:8508 length:441 start_codon:yes stop_codon:yes gene_type:complete